MTEPVIEWLDPGKTTGAAFLDMETGWFSAGQYDSDELSRHLFAMSTTYGSRLRLGYEQYLAAGGPHKGTSKHSQGAIGVIEDQVECHGITLLKSVPSSSRIVASPAFLRRMDWYTPGKQHANDAARHLLAFLLRQHPVPAFVRERLFPGYTPDATISP